MDFMAGRFFFREKFTADEKMNLAQSLLEGKAEVWFYRNQRMLPFQSWEDLKDHLLLMFGDFADSYRLLQEQRVEQKQKRMEANSDPIMDGGEAIDNIQDTESSYSKESIEKDASHEPMMVKVEGDTTMFPILDSLEDELITQNQVHVSTLEHSLQIHNESPNVCENSHDVVGCEHQRSILQVSLVKEMEEFPYQSTHGTGDNGAHQLFDQKHIKGWRFKFKEIQVGECGGSLLECVWWKLLIHYQRHGHEMQALEAENKQLLAAVLICGDVKFHLKHKWRFRLLQSFSRLILWALVSLCFSKAYELSELLKDSNNGEAESFTAAEKFYRKVQPLLWLQISSENYLIVLEFEKKKQLLGYKTRMFKYKAPLRRGQFLQYFDQEVPMQILHYFDKEVLIETNWVVQGMWDKDSPEVDIIDAYSVLYNVLEMVVDRVSKAAHVLGLTHPFKPGLEVVVHQPNHDSSTNSWMLSKDLVRLYHTSKLEDKLVFRGKVLIRFISRIRGRRSRCQLSKD